MFFDALKPFIYAEPRAFYVFCPAFAGLGASFLPQRFTALFPVLSTFLRLFQLPARARPRPPAPSRRTNTNHPPAIRRGAGCGRNRCRNPSPLSSNTCRIPSRFAQGVWDAGEISSPYVYVYCYVSGRRGWQTRTLYAFI